MALFSYPVCTWLCQYVNMGVRKWLEKSAEKQKYKLCKTLNPLSRKAFRAVSFSATKDKNRLKTSVLRRFLVRVGRLELPASCSQSKRATNCATPGYEIFQLWSNMWSTPIFDQLPARGKVLSSLLSQGFPGFPGTAARTCASRSQSKRATNCATPGYGIVLSVVLHVVLVVF